MKLSEEDRATRGRELADAVEQREAMVEKKKESAAGYRKRLDVLDHKIERLAWSVRTGLMPEEERQLALGIDAE